MAENSELVASGNRLLDLFRTPEVDLGILERGDVNDQPAIRRPSPGLIAAKNAALRQLLEDNTDREQARVLEGLAQKLGSTALNLSWVNLSGLRLNNLQLPYVNLRAAILNGTELKGANLRGADFSEALGRKMSLSGAYIIGANACGAVFQDVDLSSARAQNVDWTDADLTGANLSGALMVGSIFNQTSLARVNWRDGEVPILTDSTKINVVTSGGAIDQLLQD
ncbi:MAG: pentapeptide repeat-containing protein [Candidatus Saccharibacteria bacterium]